MQVMALHGEVACFGHTGDVNGRVSPTAATPGPHDAYHAYEGASEATGSSANTFWDDTTWAHSVRKDLNGNGGRYCWGSNSNSDAWVRMPLHSASGDVREGWIRLPLMFVGPSPGFSSSVYLISYAGASERIHLRFDINNATTWIYTYEGGGATIRDSRVTDTAKDGQWNVFELAYRIDQSNGYFRIYKNFNYNSPYLEWTGDTYNSSFAPPTAVEEVRITVSSGGGGGLDWSVSDDIKMQDLTFRPLYNSDGFIPSGVVFFPPNTLGETCNFYEKSSATQAVATLTVNASPLSTTGNGIILINGQGLDGVTGAPVNPQEFQTDAGSTSLIAASIAAAINNPLNPGTHDPDGNFGFTAVAVGNVVTITADALGAVGNTIPIQNNYGAPDVTPTGINLMTTGTEGTLLGRATIHAFNEADQNILKGVYALHTMLDGTLTEWNGRDAIAVGVYARPHDSVNVEDGYYLIAGDTIDADSGYCGDGYFYQALEPDANGAFGVNLTRGGVDQLSNWEQVNDGVGVDGEASYNFDALPDVIDVYSFDDFPVPDANVDGIKGLTLYTRAQKVSEAAERLVVVGQSGATAFGTVSLNNPLETAWTNHIITLSDDPDGLPAQVPWTQSTLNAAEFGVIFKDD